MLSIWPMSKLLSKKYCGLSDYWIITIIHNSSDLSKMVSCESVIDLPKNKTKPILHVHTGLLARCKDLQDLRENKAEIETLAKYGKRRELSQRAEGKEGDAQPQTMDPWGPRRRGRLMAASAGCIPRAASVACVPENGVEWSQKQMVDSALGDVVVAASTAWQVEDSRERSTRGEEIFLSPVDRQVLDPHPRSHTNCQMRFSAEQGSSPRRGYASAWDVERGSNQAITRPAKRGLIVPSTKKDVILK